MNPKSLIEKRAFTQQQGNTCPKFILNMKVQMYGYCIFIHQQDDITHQTQRSCPDYSKRHRLITSTCLGRYFGLFPDPFGLESSERHNKGQTHVHA